MKIEQVKKLQHKKYRQALGYCLVEGEHLILELQKASQFNPQLLDSVIYVTDRYAHWQTPFKVQQVSEKQMAQLSDTHTPQGILARVPLSAWQSGSSGNDVAVYLHEIQDPGNLGTILRTLGWFGGYRCLLSPASVDPFNPKVIRASMGAIFHVPMELEVSLETLPERFTHIACLDLQGDAITSASFKQADCYLFGNEARGVPQAALEKMKTHTYTISGKGQIESLNLATAVNICVYERQR